MREKIVPIEVTPEMMKMLEICKKNKSINPELYTQYDVKRDRKSTRLNSSHAR